MNYSAQKPISLLDALKELYPDALHKALRNMIRHSQVSVDGAVVTKCDFILHSGQEISVDTTQQAEKPVKEQKSAFEILYDDRDIIVVNKPAGLLTVALDDGSGINLLDLLRDHFHSNYISAVHRIDKETSGVLVFARRKKVVPLLNAMFQKHDFTRIYIAVVSGIVPDNEGVWESELMRSKKGGVESGSIADGGKRSVTHYTVFHRTKKYSFLELILDTGRKHQIRVHCSDAGHPIVGDKRYGSSSCNPIGRMCLHAFLLEFDHPITGEKLSFSAPIPSEFFELGCIAWNHHKRSS